MYIIQILKDLVDYSFQKLVNDTEKDDVSIPRQEWSSAFLKT